MGATPPASGPAMTPDCSAYISVTYSGTVTLSLAARNV